MPRAPMYARLRYLAVVEMATVAAQRDRQLKELGVEASIEQREEMFAPEALPTTLGNLSRTHPDRRHNILLLAGYARQYNLARAHLDRIAAVAYEHAAALELMQHWGWTLVFHTAQLTGHADRAVHRGLRDVAFERYRLAVSEVSRLEAEMDRSLEAREQELGREFPERLILRPQDRRAACVPQSVQTFNDGYGRSLLRVPDRDVGTEGMPLGAIQLADGQFVPAEMWCEQPTQRQLADRVLRLGEGTTVLVANEYRERDKDGIAGHVNVWRVVRHPAAKSGLAVLVIDDTLGIDICCPTTNAGSMGSPSLASEVLSATRTANSSGRPTRTSCRPLCRVAPSNRCNSAHRPIPTTSLRHRTDDLTARTPDTPRKRPEPIVPLLSGCSRHSVRLHSTSPSPPRRPLSPYAIIGCCDRKWIGSAPISKVCVRRSKISVLAPGMP